MNKGIYTLYYYDHIYDEVTTHNEILEQILPTLSGVFQGYTINYFFYGSTKTGKTYQIEGNQYTPGLLHLSIISLYHKFEQNKNRNSFSISISRLQITSNEIVDLIQNEVIEISQNKIKHSLVKTPAYVDALRIYNESKANYRKVDSHIITTFTVEFSTQGQKAMKKQRVNFVELANSSTKDIMIQKSFELLKSLLNEKGLDFAQPLTQFKLSPLTLYLHSSLKYNSRILMFITMCNDTDINVSMNDLQFGLDAKPSNIMI